MDEFNGTATPDRAEALKGLMDAERERALRHTNKARKNYYVWHAFCTTEMAVSNGIMGLNFFVMSLSYYGLMLNMETLSGSVFMNVFTMATMCYIFNVIYAILDFTIPKVGRKPAYIFPLLVVLVCLGTVITLKSLDLFMPWLETAALLVSTAIVAQQLSVAPIIGGELFPTPVRNAAQSFQQFCMRGGVIVSPQLFVGLKAWPIAPYLTLAVLNLAAVITFGWLIRETKGVELVEHMPPKKTKIQPV
uniref:MFS domain-containing protein n=1 Tax=Panagrellus redivivus TaxID=6233 RepID=A0A7E4V3B6_PANRE